MDMERTLLEVLLEQANNKKWADNSFKKKVWSAAEAAVQGLYSGLTYDQAKNKVDSYKTKWKAWIKLNQQSGFG